MRVLVIEDDPDVSEFIEIMLNLADMDTVMTMLGKDGIKLAKRDDYDLLLLDLSLPDMDGHDVLRQLRVAGIQTPVLVLSGANDKENKIRSFEYGADDYLTKPFIREELYARIHAVTRRTRSNTQSIIRTGQVEVNLDAKTVQVDSKLVDLTYKEYQMLELLTLRKGTTLTKKAILSQVYNGMDEPELKIIDVFICNLRKKLSCATGGETIIETVWGRGYKLRDPLLVL